jgi:integrase
MNKLTKHTGNNLPQKVQIKDQEFAFEETLPASFNQYEETATKLLSNNRSANTIATYTSNFKPFLDFCDFNNVKPIPADPRTVLAFISYQASHCVSKYDHRLSVSTISTRLAAIRHFHLQSNYISPTEHKMNVDALNGLKRERGREIKDTRQDPILYFDLEQMLAAVGPDDSLQAIRDKAILTLGLQGGFRRSELADLRFKDVVFLRNSLRIYITYSKANQSGDREWKDLPANEPFSSRDYVKKWVECSDVKNGHLFRSIARNGKKIRLNEVSEKSGKTLGVISGNDIYRLIKKYSLKAGLNSSTLGAHSLRSGCVTQLAEDSKTDLFIMGRTGHQDPRSLQNYIKKKE